MKKSSYLPLISIVTPSFNQAGFIERTIKSVINQDYPNIEYIVMDGGSTDGTIEILKKYDGRLKWFSEKDNGQADAINKGMKMVRTLRRTSEPLYQRSETPYRKPQTAIHPHPDKTGFSGTGAKGEIVAYLNSDDTYEPDTFSSVSRFFRENPERIWVSGRCNLIDENDNPTRGFIKKYREFWANLKLPFVFFLINFIAQPATFWKREAFERIGFFDTSASLSVNPEQPYDNRPQCLPLECRRVDESLCYAFDYDFWLRLTKLQPPVVVNRTLANFRVHPSSKGKTGPEKQFLEDFRVVSRHTRNPFFLFCHFLSNLSLVLAYNLLRRIK